MVRDAEGGRGRPSSDAEQDIALAARDIQLGADPRHVVARVSVARSAYPVFLAAIFPETPVPARAVGAPPRPRSVRPPRASCDDAPSESACALIDVVCERGVCYGGHNSVSIDRLVPRGNPAPTGNRPAPPTRAAPGTRLARAGPIGAHRTTALMFVRRASRGLMRARRRPRRPPPPPPGSPAPARPSRVPVSSTPTPSRRTFEAAASASAAAMPSSPPSRARADTTVGSTAAIAAGTARRDLPRDPRRWSSWERKPRPPRPPATPRGRPGARGKRSTSTGKRPGASLGYHRVHVRPPPRPSGRRPPEDAPRAGRPRARDRVRVGVRVETSAAAHLPRPPRVAAHLPRPPRGSSPLRENHPPSRRRPINTDNSGHDTCPKRRRLRPFLRLSRRRRRRPVVRPSPTVPPSRSATC